MHRGVLNIPHEISEYKGREDQAAALANICGGYAALEEFENAGTKNAPPSPP